ncbi:ABC transporter permease [Terriglobus albidus]|nr:ABC transporter permease [Terriglobus albidus]
MIPTPMWRRYARFFGADPVADVDDELRFHLETKTEELIAQGWQPGEARKEAERQFGDLRMIRNVGKAFGQKDQKRKRFNDYWTDAQQDLRYTFRILLRDRGFAAISVLILALAIGANISVFSVVNSLLLRPLPFPESNRLVWIAPPPSECGLSCATYSADAYDEFRAGNRTFQDVTGYFAFSTADNLRLRGHGDPVPVTGLDVIGNFFQVLGVQPAMGRLFTADEGRKGSQPAVLLSNAFWKRQFAADPNIIGKPISLSGQAGELVTVVGVLPASFDFGAVFAPGTRIDVFTPLYLDQARDWGNIVTLIGRLKPHVTAAQALDDANRIAPDIYFNVKYPETKGRYKGDLIPVSLKDHVTGALRRSLIILWSAVGLILLIAGVNLSNLLLARSAARAKEFAIRSALGASRSRVVRQLLMESFVLSSAGAVLGIALAAILLRWLSHQGSLALPLLSSLRIDGHAAGWSVLIVTFTALLFGFLPGLRMSRVNHQEALKDSGQRAGLGRTHERLRSTLVVSEIALACVLLISAGLLLRSFLKVLDVDLGFRPDSAASIKFDYEDSAPTFEAAAAKRGAIFQQALTQISALPGVEAAGIADYLPLGPNRQWDEPAPQGKTFARGTLPSPLVYVVSPGFFRAMGIQFEGRDFTWADNLQSQRVVLINHSAARVYWPGESAVGKILMRGKEADHVIGVVNDVREEDVEAGTGSQIYYPATQQDPAGAQLVIRTSLPPASLATGILHILRALNPRQPAAEFRPLRTIVDRAVSPRRFFMMLVGAFASLGVLLAALGIYGIISYSVTQKTQEIGVRMALGATTGRVRRDVILSTLRLAAIGIVTGTVVSITSARLIASLLFGTSPWDMTTYLVMMLAILAVALMSGYLPARRASRVDPLAALRIQ